MAKKNSKKFSNNALSLAIIVSFATYIISLAVSSQSFNLLTNAILLLPIAALPFLILLPASKHMKSIKDKVSKDSLLFRMGQKRVSYLENIIQNSTDIIFTLDSDLLILRFNKGAEYHSGYSQEEILGKPLSLLFKDSQTIDAIIKEVKEGGSAINHEIALTTKSLEIKELNVSLSEMNYGNSAINGFVITAKDITEKKILERELLDKNIQLKKLAITDSLTQLYNVRHFKTQLSGELKRIKRNPDRKLSLIMIDVDNFKELNDTHGHQAGDEMLKLLAGIIRLCIREDIDSACRYGGDEFVIILPDTDKDSAARVSARIQSKFAEKHLGHTSLSIGITDLIAGDDETSFIKRSDEAMYISKNSGKGKETTL